MKARLLPFAAAALLSCMGGTGTDTENGISAQVKTPGGDPVPGVTLIVHTAAYRPDSGGTENLLSDSGAVLKTDVRGYAHFRLKSAGTYVVEGVKDKATLLFDTLRVDDANQETRLTMLVRDVAGFQGVVKLSSGLRIDSGMVFLRGTRHAVRLDTAGRYHLGAMPWTAVYMGVGVQYRASPREIRLVEQDSGGSKLRPTYTCREVSQDSLERLRNALGVAGPNTQPATLDTVEAKRALLQCDSLEKGMQVSLRVPSIKDQPLSKPTLVPYVVVSDSAVDSTGRTLPPVLVPLANCVQSAAGMTGTFAVSPQDSFTGVDLEVGDVSRQCAQPERAAAEAAAARKP